MITPGLEDVQNQFFSRYDLVIMAADRAKQIQQGAAPLIKTSSHHPLSIAMEEIAAGVYPPVAKESPKELDEEFISGALADQGIRDLSGRFDSASEAAAEEAAGSPAEDAEDEENDEE